MIFKLVTCLITILALTSAVFSATYEGLVISIKDGTPIDGATIFLESDRSFIECNDDGYFTVMHDNDQVMITVSHVGYASVKNFELSSGGANLIKMTPVISSLDNVVVTANRYSQEAYKVTQPISAIGSDDIQNGGNAIVSDIIRDFPGIDMNDAGPFRARPVIRGLYGTRILVLVDGERLNDQRDISAFAGVSQSLVDVNEIERIEVVNGPSSVLYGSDAMGGVINIITKENNFNSKLTPIISYSGRYSTADEQLSNRFDIGLQSEKLSGSFGVMFREAKIDYTVPSGWNEGNKYNVYRDEFYDDLNSNQGTTYDSDGVANSKAKIRNIDANMGYKLSDKYRLNFDFGSFRADNIGYPGVPNDSTPYLFLYPNHDRDNATITLTGKNISGKLLKLTGKVYYEKISKDFFTDFFEEIIPLGPGMSMALLNSTTHTEVSKYGFNFQELYSLSKEMNVTFGFDYLHEKIDGDVTTLTRFDGMGPMPIHDTTAGASVPKNNWNALGLYFSSETLTNPMLLTIGLRYDNFWIKTEETDGYEDSNGNSLPTDDERYVSFNGSFGAVYPLTKAVNLVANVGTAYRVPNVVERFYYGSASGRETRPNPDIKPEKSVSFDIGVKAIHEKVNYSLMGFYSDYTDFTQLQKFDSTAEHGGYSPLWRYENIEDVVIYGVESIVEVNLDNGIYSRMNLSYQHGQNRTFDSPIFVSPLKTVITGGYRNKTHKFFGELTAKIIGDQNRVPEVAYLDDIQTEGYFILNSTAGIQINKYVKFTVTVKNLLDEVYSEPFNARNPDNPIPEPGRNFVFSINANL